jgi:Transposase IS116/IS110/IS902 family
MRTSIEADIARRFEHHQVDKLLTTIEGIGPQTAACIIAELGDPARFGSIKALASYVGVIPRLRQSGKRRLSGRRLLALGNARLRRALWMPTLSAIRVNPWLRAYYLRLRTAGKRPKVALIAVKPPQGVVSRADREVLHPVSHPRVEILQRGDQAGSFPAVRGLEIVICSYNFARSKAGDVNQLAVGPGGHRRSPSPAQRVQAIERHRQHAQAGVGWQGQAPPHGYAAPELSTRVVWSCQFYRRAGVTPIR